MTPNREPVAFLGSLALGAAAASFAVAADLEAGADLATQCAACHGPAGVSTDGQFPNLAAQKEAYIASQLEAFRGGERANPLMNAVANALSDTDIENLAAHFASLPGAAPGEAFPNATALDGSLPGFPADYADSFTEYHRIDFEDRQQVRAYLANDVALEAATTGGELPDGAYLLVEIFGAETDAEGNLAKDETAG